MEQSMTNSIKPPVDCSGEVKTNGVDTEAKDDNNRFIMEGLDENSEQFEEVIKRLQCSLCQCLCMPKNTFICTSGHLTCGNCCPNFVENCAQPAGQVHGKDYGCCGMELEELVDKVFDQLYLKQKFTTRCPEWTNGCDIKLEVNDVAEHHQKCPFRQAFGCPYVNCESGDFNVYQLVDHLCSKHASLLKDMDIADESELIEMVLERAPDGCLEYLWIPAIFKFQNIHLLLTVELRHKAVRIWFSRLEKSEKVFDPQIQLWKKKFSADSNGKVSWEAWGPKVIDYSIPGDQLTTGMYEKEEDGFYKFYTEAVNDQQNAFRMRAYVILD